jgi:hypothetical protein
LELTCDGLPLSVRSLRPRHGLVLYDLFFSCGEKTGPTRRRKRALSLATLWTWSALSGFLFGQPTTDASLQACAYFGRIMALPRVKRFFLRSTRDRRSTQDRRIAPGVRLLRPNHGPAPRRAVFSSVNSRLTVNSRPTHRSRRALTSAESWPCPASSGFLFGHVNK